MGRTLAAWQLYRRQFDTSHIFAVDEILLEDRQGYYRALHRAQTQGSDLTGWVEYIAEAVAEALERAWKRVQSVNLSPVDSQLTLTPKQEKLLSLLRGAPLGIQEIQKALSVTKPGAHHILTGQLAAHFAHASLD